MIKIKTGPSKEERHKVYKRLLKLYKSDTCFNSIEKDWLGFEIFHTAGLCKGLEELWWKDRGKTIQETNIRSYPELMQRKFNPEKHYWDLREHGYLQRVILLLDAINKTK